MNFRNTFGIISPGPDVDPAKDADYIITAAVAGFVAERFRAGSNVQIDVDPDSSADVPALSEALETLGTLAARANPDGGAQNVSAGVTVDHERGAAVIGAYSLAGQDDPTTAEISNPEQFLTDRGKDLYNTIKENDQDPNFQYIGRGAYTGFVDNPNSVGDTEPVGPMSTVRCAVPDFAQGGEAEAISQGWHPRWLPHKDSKVWNKRTRRGAPDDGARVAWGLIKGDEATLEPDPDKPNPGNATNRADQMTDIMRESGMVFLDQEHDADIHGYTHGMVQAIYKGYDLGPSCRPYEITVGNSTTKLASCFGCTVFMMANGYPPSSIHLGSAESWLPFYSAHSDKGKRYPNGLNPNVIRDLNYSFAEYCDTILRLGLEALGEDDVHMDYAGYPKALATALGGEFDRGNLVAATLILDALTVHDKEINRVRRVLGLDE